MPWVFFTDKYQKEYFQCPECNSKRFLKDDEKLFCVACGWVREWVKK